MQSVVQLSVSSRTVPSLCPVCNGIWGDCAHHVNRQFPEFGSNTDGIRNRDQLTVQRQYRSDADAESTHSLSQFKIKNDDDQSEYNPILMDWLKIANAVQHEMFPAIGRSMKKVIESMISDGLLKAHQLGDIETNQVIEQLQKVRKLSTKEIDIIKGIVRRAVTHKKGT